MAISLFGFLVEAALERNLTEEFKPVMTVGLVNNQSLDRWDSKNLNTDLCPEHIPIIGILKREWAEPYIPFQDGECYTQNITLNLPAALQNNTKVIYKCSRPLNDIDIDEGFFRQLDFEFYPDSLIMRF